MSFLTFYLIMVLVSFKYDLILSYITKERFNKGLALITALLWPVTTLVIFILIMTTDRADEIIIDRNRKRETE